MTLEMRYRRLLAVYPAEHRRAYAEEMVGVLMEGAQPGQRRPSLRETADLMWCGLAARAGRGARMFRGAGWPDAAAVAGLIGAVLLAAVAGRRLATSIPIIREYGAGVLPAYGVDGGQLIDVGLRALVWLAVVAAALARLRRTTAALAILGLLVEVAAIAVWTPTEAFRPIRMSWALTLSALVVLLLAAARRARPPAAVLGRTGTALLLTPFALALAVGLAGPTVAGLDRWSTGTQIAGLVSVRDVLAAAGVVLLALGVRRAPRGIRGRIAVLLAPLTAVPVAQWSLEKVIGIQFAPAVTPGIVLADVVIMIGLPVLALALAAGVLSTIENGRIGPAREAWDEITPGTGAA